MAKEHILRMRYTRSALACMRSLAAFVCTTTAAFYGYIVTHFLMKQAQPRFCELCIVCQYHLLIYSHV